MNFFESFLNIILTSAFTSEIDLDFSIYLLSYIFFIGWFIIPCLCPILNSFFSSTCFIKEMKVYLISSQKVSQNSLFKSSLYGYLLFFILLMDSAISLFQLFLSQKFICSAESIHVSVVFQKRPKSPWHFQVEFGKKVA